MSSYDSKNDGIPLSGVLFVIFICSMWGMNMVTIKYSNQGVPPILAATIRSAVASFLLFLLGTIRGQSVWLRGPELKHGIVIGMLFAVDFLFLYWGPAFTNASRAVIFLYTQPLWTALFAHFLLADDRLNKMKTIGLVVAFAGLITVFGARDETLGPNYWIGDLMEVGAAIAWAITTIYIKRFVRDKPITHYQTLFGQLFWSIPLLAVCFVIVEWGRPVVITGPILAALGYQTVVIAFFSYLLWFWMIHTYTVSKLAAFTFLAPMFGVIFSGLLLGEALPIPLWIGLAMVATGIYLVNRPEPAVAPAHVIAAEDED